MQIPVDIVFRDLPSSDAVTRAARKWVDKLERYYDRITRCEVLIETPHKHQRTGRQFHVRIRITVPGGEIVVSHDPGPGGAHEDVYVALRDAFHAATRQLEDHVQKLRREVKAHAASSQHGRVIYLDAEGAWGWLESGDGRRIYFHRNSVLGGADHVAVGDEVRFAEEAGREGPQASTVEPIGQHGRHAMTAV